MASTGVCSGWKDFGTARHEFRPSARVQSSMLASVEKKTLVWLARRAPGWINSDHLTALALVAMVAAGAAYFYSREHSWALWLVNACLALNWLGDSLDGTLARERKLLRPRYGFYVDHLCDAFSALFLFTGLALSGFMHPVIAAGLLLAYLLLSIEAYLATYTMGTFKISQFKFGPTELRLLLATGNAFVVSHPRIHVFGYAMRLFDFGGAIGIAGMLLVLLWVAGRHTWTLYQEERLW